MRPCSTSRRGGSRTRSWPPTPARRSGCGAARPAGSRSRERIPALPRFFERMYDQRWSPEWVAQEFDSTYKDLIFAAHSRDAGRARAVARRARCSTSAVTPGRFLQLAGEAGWRAEGTEINERTATHAAAAPGVPVHRLSAERLPELGRQLRRRHAHRRARAHSRTGGAAVDRSPRRRRRRVGGRQGAMRSGAVAEGDLAGASQPRLSGHACRQPRAHQPLFSARAAARARAGGLRRDHRRDRRARVPARRREHRRSSGSRSTTSAGACPAESTRRSRCTCRRSRAPDGRRQTITTMTDFVPSLSVVIPTYNNEAVLRRCLDQLAVRAPPPRRRDHRHRGRVPRRHARVSRGREPVALGPAAPALAFTWTTRTSCGVRTRGWRPRGRR